MTSLLLSLGAGGATSTASAAAVGAKRKSLVAFVSRSGNTRVAAGQVARSLQADLFEIEPEIAYPEDYFETVEQVTREMDQGFEPPLKSIVSDIHQYATVFLGFPIWGTTAPPVIRSFLSAHDLSGKTLVPLVRHGGYGLGDSRSVLAAHAPLARLVEGFSLQAPQERKTVTQVMSWLDGYSPRSE